MPDRCCKNSCMRLISCRQFEQHEGPMACPLPECSDHLLAHQQLPLTDLHVICQALEPCKHGCSKSSMADMSSQGSHNDYLPLSRPTQPDLFEGLLHFKLQGSSCWEIKAYVFECIDMHLSSCLAVAWFFRGDIHCFLLGMLNAKYKVHHDIALLPHAAPEHKRSLLLQLRLGRAPTIMLSARLQKCHAKGSLDIRFSSRMWLHMLQWLVFLPALESVLEK